MSKQALELVIKMQEKHVKEKQIEHQKEIIQLQEKLKSNLARQIKVSDNLMTLQDQFKKASQVGSIVMSSQCNISD